MHKTKNTLQQLLLAAAFALPVAAYAAGDAGDAPQGPNANAEAPGARPEGPGRQECGPAAPGKHEGGRPGARGPGGEGGPEGRGGPEGHGGPGGFGGPGGPGGPGQGGPHAFFLHGLDLTDAQDDKIFALVHAQEPVLREQHKIIEKSRKALHEMRESGKYDDAKAATLAQAEAAATVKITLTQLRTEQQILGTLTAQQRTKLEERRHPKEDGEKGPGPRPAPQAK
jgi:Spy/CpxP family protein refolding chaperone